jgi:hypothetical protein
VKEECIGYLWDSQKERDSYGNQDVCAWKIRKCILERYGEMVWNGLIWLKIGPSGGF